MTDWAYYAGSKASLSDGLRLLDRFGLIWRSARNKAGQLIPNVGQLNVGDTLHFVFREGGEARYVFRASIGKPATPSAGAPAIDRIAGLASAQLEEAGYPRTADGLMEVIHLEGVDIVEERPLVEPAPSQTALWPGKPVPLNRQ
jgi:hypothetical protein